MNLAPLAQLLTTLVQAADNNTALALSDTNETVSPTVSTESFKPNG